MVPVTLKRGTVVVVLVALVVIALLTKRPREVIGTEFASLPKAAADSIVYYTTYSKGEDQED